MSIRFTLALSCCAMMTAGVSRADSQPEFRGAWVTRFEWPTPDPAECKARITQVFETLAARNFNAAVFQIRGEADTLYPSEMEPWSELIGGKDPGFDPLAFAIQEAHRRGIQFHAYMNPMPLRALTWRSPPQDSRHLWHRHGPGSAEPWICVDRVGKPAREQYYYLSAGVPEVHVHLRRVIMDVVRRYDVDGIHLDRIRYPGPEYSFDPISNRRFAGRGNPQLLERSDWQRHQLDKLINDLAAEIRAEKPKVLLSCSAWGIYNRHHIPGYHEFSSGYHDYSQDTWNWVRLGAMDLLIPMIYWNLADPKPNYDELLDDFVRGVGAGHVAGGQAVFSPDENVRQIQATRKAGACGTVLFTLRSAQRRGVVDRVHKELYQEKVAPPIPARVTAPQTGTILGTVVADDGAPLVDAWVSIHAPATTSDAAGSRRRRPSGPTWTSGADGRFAFHNLPPGEARVTVKYEGAPPADSGPVQVKAGEVTRVEVKVPGALELRDQPYVAVVRPADGADTSREVVHVLGRTVPGHRVSVAGKDVEVFATGGFARDNIPLQPGENRIDVTVSDGTRRLTRTLTVIRTPAPETARAEETSPGPEAPRAPYQAWDPEKTHVAETTSPQTGITHGLHSVRLGGPWLAWVPTGTRLEVIGKQGRSCHVRLSPAMTGWVSEEDIRLLPDGTPIPHNFFTAAEVSGTDDHDTFSLGMSAPVVAAVRTEIEPRNCVIIDFFNTHDAATWLSHKSGAKILGPVRVEQIETERVRVTVPINAKQNWGYWTEIKDGRFTLHVRRPPRLAAAPDSPLKGLLVAVEAGHGGSNDGAVGLLGTREKTVNLAGALALQSELEKRGARVIQVRRGDESVSLSERVDRANEANADLFVSIHANAAGSARGYLSISGTSTYYHGIHCRLPAQRVYEELLKLGWGEFGVVGNFSYSPLRNTRIPSILVEQAFMSHPGDEARLLDPQYQGQQAIAIANGLESFLSSVRE